MRDNILFKINRDVADSLNDILSAILTSSTFWLVSLGIIFSLAIVATAQHFIRKNCRDEESASKKTEIFLRLYMVFSFIVIATYFFYSEDDNTKRHKNETSGNEKSRLTSTDKGFSSCVDECKNKCIGNFSRASEVNGTKAFTDSYRSLNESKYDSKVKEVCLNECSTQCASSSYKSQNTTGVRRQEIPSARQNYDVAEINSLRDQQKNILNKTDDYPDSNTKASNSVASTSKKINEGIGKVEWFHKAASLEASGDWHNLILWCYKWTDSNPNIDTPWYLMGVAYSKLQRDSDAVKSFRQAIRINSENSQAWLNLGLAYSRSGHQDVALDIAKKMQKIDPKLSKELSALITPSKKQ